jgi:hypothetical protein
MAAGRQRRVHGVRAAGFGQSGLAVHGVDRRHAPAVGARLPWMIGQELR